ncbi:LacI family DNA-binding transcriptional regulator [Sphingomonas sp. AOB5]|uniref:LacI family DNA-binding transcriptional regulator n=1 Tax=Sphingomonas sp. AOB5 TaxID=3034017 RepID=UPI0023F7ADE2|nr:LacI family DNA-binding transcriptional regulator [Sphingomonas sp. AOB5]MDF7775261.1 LacI family DNA-binding transcriptional regulator [Sphingomonas sp. AOB5]
MTSRPTIKEVSKIAGVSFKTVSRVLNNEKHVSEATRRKVEEAVATLNFRPSHAARTLAGRRSFQVALIYDNPSPYYVYHVQTGAQERCVELGFRLLHQPCDSQASDLTSSVTALIDEAHLDGVIISPPVSDAMGLIEELERRNISHVRIAPGVRRGTGLSVSIDDVAAGREMTEHLLSLGHRAIAFIKGPPNHISSDERLEGYRAALDAAGVAFVPELVVQGDYSFVSGRKAAQALLDLPKPPTAIFAGNDDMAAGALAVAHERDISVPAQLSIAGFDDTDLARAVWPPLTTIHQPVRDLAYAAANLLLGGENKSDQLVLEHTLQKRGSTGPAPGK